MVFELIILTACRQPFLCIYFFPSPIKLYIKDESSECDITLWTLQCQFFGSFLFVFCG